MKKRVVALAIALGCLIGLTIVFTELTEIDPFLRHTVLRAASPQLKERLCLWRAPLVINSSPEQGQSDVLPRSPITLTFLTPMNPSTVERNISFEPQVPGQFSWRDERSLVFTPAQPWPAGTGITVEVSRGARSWLLRRMEEPFAFDFTILASPIVVGTEPSHQTHYIHSPDRIAITFSHLMDEASVESHLSIEPQIRDLKLAWVEETLAISGDFQPETTYQVTISKGAQDAAYGLATAEDFVWSFTVVERQPGLAVAGPGYVGMVMAEAPFQLPLTTLNLSRIDLALYTLDEPTLVALQGLSAKDWEQYRPEENPVREWSASVEAKVDQEMPQRVKVNPLPPGFYFLAVSSPEGIRTGHLLSVSRSALIIKRAPGQVLAWLVALTDGSPIADAKVTIYEKGGRVLAIGQTDREGVFKSSLPQAAGHLLAIAGREGDVAVCAEEWSATIVPEAEELSDKVYVDTNQSVYHPGQEVHFKAVVRHDDDGRYALLPANTALPVVVTDEAGRSMYHDTFQLTPFGSLSGSFPLSEEAPAGRYRLAVNIGGEEHESHFQVARPRRPGYAVSVTTDQPSYVRGDVITATVSASYDFEVPVVSAEVSYALYATNYLPLPDGDFDFGWMGQEEVDSGQQTIVSGRGVTDNTGRFTVILSTDVKPLTGSLFCTLEATVTAPSQQSVSTSTSFPIHQSSFYIGLRPERRVGRVGREVAFDVQTVDTEGLVLNRSPEQSRRGSEGTVEGPVLSEVEGQPRGWIRLRYTLDLVEWRRDENTGAWAERSTEVTRGSLRTDGQGQAQIAFRPTVGGVYRLRVEGEDERGDRVASSTQLWVSETVSGLSTSSERWVIWPEGDQLELIADKARYRAGEVAEVMVLSPYQRATALLTVERGRVLAHRTVELEGYSDTVSVPVEPEYFPNVFVSAVLIPGHHPDGEPPGIKIGYAELNVEPTAKELMISLSPEKERYQPGEQVTYTVRAADGEGQPLNAEVWLTVGAASGEMPGILETFYGRRELAVRTAESSAVYLGRERMAGGVEDPTTVKALNSPRNSVPEGTSQPQPGIDNAWPSREPAVSPADAPEVAYWNPAVVTGEDGQARVSFRLPDKLTTWRVLVQGVTVDTRVGAATADLVVSQDLSARLVSPPFLRMGDQPVIEELLHNHTDKPLETAVALTATGLELQKPLTRTVVISADEMARVGWPATASQESIAAVALSVAGGVITDEANLTIPILPFGEEGELTDAGGVEDEIALTVSVPTDAFTAALTIKGFPSLLALTVDSLDYLQSYPYGSTEQAASWLLAVASVRQTLGELDREGEALSQELARQGQAALWRLYRFQGDDGHWGWWEDSEPSPYLTAQVVYSLIQAQKAGLPIDEKVLEKGVRALQGNLKDSEDPNLEAYLLCVLTKTGEGSPALADSLLKHREELAPWARARLAMTMHTLGRADGASGLMADLASEATVTVGTAHWQEGRLADEAMASEISTTALAMQALLQVNPDDPLIPKALDWLIRVQQDGHWPTPQETAMVIAALTDYLAVKGERVPDHRYQVLVNDQVVGSGVSTKENMTIPVKLVVTELADGDNEVRLVKEGKERLHYALTLRYYWPREHPEPARALGGTSLSREYFDPITGEPKTEYRVGDLIGVRLMVKAPQEMWYVTIEDPLPAGVEAVEESLKVEANPEPALNLALSEDFGELSRTVEGKVERNPIHFEKRAEKVALFIQRAEAGEHVYHYLVRATVPGRFRSMPALAYPMYEPSLWGRSASGLLQVESLTFPPK